MQKFLFSAWQQYGRETLEATSDFAIAIDDLRTKATKQFANLNTKIDNRISGTISVSDAKLLYCLFRYYQPKNVFEIGTWIGSSSLVMAKALKRNGTGCIYTCDINSYYALSQEYDDVIIRINTTSSEAIAQIPNDQKIDFVFIDGSLDQETIDKLLPRLSDHCIIALHDFIIPEKGVHNACQLLLASKFSYSLLQPTPLHHPFDIRSSIALLLPSALTGDLSQYHKPRWKKRSEAYQLLIRYYLGRAIKKI
jgi:predicted O-methyltransferase YrrM